MIQPQAFESRILRQYRSPPIDSSSTTETAIPFSNGDPFRGCDACNRSIGLA